MNRKSDIVENSNESARCEWTRPSLRKVDAREAEVSNHLNSDGAVNS